MHRSGQANTGFQLGWGGGEKKEKEDGLQVAYQLRVIIGENPLVELKMG